MRILKGLKADSGVPGLTQNLEGEMAEKEIGVKTSLFSEKNLQRLYGLSFDLRVVPYDESGGYAVCILVPYSNRKTAEKLYREIK